MPRPQGLTRSFAALPAPPAPYTPAGPYTRRMSPYTSRRLLTRPQGLTRAIGALHARRALHATNVALHEPKAPYTRHRRLTLSDDLHFAVRSDLDDAAGLVGEMLLAAGPAHIVDGFEQLRGDVAVVLGGGLAADVRAGADNGLLEAVAELAGESLAGDAHGNAAIFGDEVRRQVHRVVEDHRRWLRGKFHHVPGHVRYIPHIALQACFTVDEADERFRVVALFDLIDARHRLGVCGIAADTPDGVGRVEDDATLAHHFHRFLNIFFQFHNPLNLEL